jgi:L-ascorbate metabolism protein UlaG (beta-lactamase superfamily)
MKVTWFGHSAVRVENGSHVILIDPFFTGNPAFKGSVEEAARGATHVVLTHGHDDHVGDTVSICKSTGATLVAGFEIAMYLAGQGVAKLEPGNAGGTIDLGGRVSASFVRADHSSSTIVDGKPIYLGNPCGVVLQGMGKTIYHMGDTEIFSDMALIEELYQPKIGFVPIGDRFTMGAKTAALACKRYFQFSMVIPIHYGSYPIIDQSPDKFIAAMDGQNVMVPEIGKAFEL